MSQTHHLSTDLEDVGSWERIVDSDHPDGFAYRSGKLQVVVLRDNKRCDVIDYHVFRDLDGPPWVVRKRDLIEEVEDDGRNVPEWKNAIKNEDGDSELPWRRK